jgi:uncharacterized protein YukE
MDLINYPHDAMAEAAAAMATASAKSGDLTDRFNSAMNALLDAWQTQLATDEVSAIRQLWVQASSELNTVLNRRGTALGDASNAMHSTDSFLSNVFAQIRA